MQVLFRSGLPFSRKSCHRSPVWRFFFRCKGIIVFMRHHLIILYSVSKKIYPTRYNGYNHSPTPPYPGFLTVTVWNGATGAISMWERNISMVIPISSIYLHRMTDNFHPWDMSYSFINSWCKSRSSPTASESAPTVSYLSLSTVQNVIPRLP